MRRFAPKREHFIPKGARKIAHKHSSAVVYIYEKQNRLCVIGFHGKAQRADFHFYYSKETQREKRIVEFFERCHAAEQRRRDEHKARVAWKHNYKAGDLFRTHWGYDQTNIEYFECVEVRGKMLVLREIAQERTETGFMSGQCVPMPGKYIGEPTKRLAQQGGVRICQTRWARYVEPKRVAGVPVYETSYWSSYA